MHTSNKQYIQKSSWLSKGLFLLISILGAIIIWYLKYNNFSPIITIAVPVGLIFLYCGLAWQTKTFRIREDLLGDNAYYLGFLFTLSSLAYALWRFQIEQGSDPSDIIGSFGVALWSTIVGIALRVFFSQIQMDPNDIEREARNKIAQGMNDLMHELSQSSLAFNTYTRGLKQSVEEAFEQTNKITQNLTNSLEELNKKINETETPNDLLNKKIESLFQGMENTTTEMSSLIEKQALSIKTAIESSEGMVESLTEINNQFHNIKESDKIIEKSNIAFKKLAESIHTLEKRCTKFSDELSKIEASQKLTVSSVETHANELEKQLKKSRKYTQDTHNALVAMVKTLKEKL